MFVVIIGSRQKQSPLGTESKVCPNCLKVTEHEVVEDVVRLTVFGLPLFTVDKQAVYLCPECGDIHSVSWEEYEKRRADTGDAPVGDKPLDRRELARQILEGRTVPSIEPPSDLMQALRLLGISLLVIFLIIAIATAGIVIAILL